MKQSMVHIIGCGPGDPKLLTVKAKEIIEKADAILYDRLINEKILTMAKPGCNLVYVGKANTEGGKSQENTNRLLVDYAKKYKIVARLKGGDPFLFGRGGEEAETLANNKINFEIIPGITSAIAIPAYAGIPVTHREYSSSIHVFTGHGKEDLDNLDFNNIAKLNGTIIFLMGIKNLDRIVKGLIENGKSHDTPIALIENGTTNNQKVVRSDLKNIVNLAEKNNINPPAIIIIGDVVKLNERLKWFDNKPLFGKKILITRALDHNNFCGKLQELGAVIIEMPFIRISDNSHEFINENFLQSLNDYSSILFNSVNSVKFFFERLKMMNKDLRILGNCMIGVIGKGTEQEIKNYGVIPDFIPDRYTVDDLIKLAVNKNNKKKILILTSDLSPINPGKIKQEYSVEVKKIELYKTEKIQVDIDNLKSVIEDGLDLITFLSSSTVDSFFENYSKLDEKTKQKIDKINIASIGTMTSDTIKKYNHDVTIEAKEFYIEGLTKSIVEYYNSPPGSKIATET